MIFSRCRRLLPLLLLAILATATGSCRKRKAEVPSASVEASGLLTANQMGGLPGPVYESQVKSAIHWQSWTKETFRRAEEADRLIFAVIALPQQPGFMEVLKGLESDAAMVKELNENYVPVLVDGDSVREMSLLTAPLCAEIKQPLTLPVFVWMAYDRNPVAWIPVQERSPEGVLRLFNQAHGMVKRMWQEDPAYVMKNSGLDNASRRERMLAELKGPVPSSRPSEDVLQAARQLISLYDPVSRNIDQAGGLFPTGMLEVVTAAAMMPDVPEALRAKALETTKALLEDLIHSAMFDPLEGGVFSGRASQTWNLPSFTINCQDQARIASVLLRAHALTGDPVVLERALGLIAFAERKFQGDDGLFRVGSFGSAENSVWLWSEEDIGKALSPEDAKWWMAATGMKGIGNLPSEADPQRKLFRRNSLAVPRPLAETAAELGIPAADFAKRFEQSRAKLLEIRNARMGTTFENPTAQAGATFRMVSAYASAFTATGDAQYREKAVALLAGAKKAFSEGDCLNSYVPGAEPTLIAGRAFHYAVAIQAAQDVSDITSDEGALAMSAKLAATAEKLFLGENRLNEVESDVRLLELPIVDMRKLFDDSSGGLYAISEARHPDSESLKKLASPLSHHALQLPIIYTDVIFAALIKHHGKSVVRGTDLSPELRAAVERLPLHVVPRGPAKVSDGVPAGSVGIISPGGTAKLVSTAAELRRELMLSNQNP